MFFDFIIELSSDFSAMYFYFSAVLTVLFSIHWMPLVAQNVYRDTRITIETIHNGKAEQSTRNHSINKMNKKRNWLAIITKRIETPDDDDEASFSLYFNRVRQLQGGTTCKNNLYSHSLEKQVLSVSLV
jgi:hypothetical protein